MHSKAIVVSLLYLTVLVQSIPLGQYVKYRVSNKYFDQFNQNYPQSKDPIYELLSRVHNDKIPHLDATLIKTNEIIQQNSTVEEVKPVQSEIKVK